MKLEIIFESDDLLVLNKPSGLVVNKSQTIKEETLQDQLMTYFKLGDQLGIGDRAGIVHRLDKETSGLVLVAKTDKIFEKLQEQFRNRQVKKEYVALVHGIMEKDQVTVANKIGRIGKFGKFGEVDRRNENGREAETVFETVDSFQLAAIKFKELVELSGANRVRQKYLEKQAKYYTLVSVFPKTGRTHQIRVHTKSLGHPVVADLIYEPGKLIKFDLLWCTRLFLHAKKISFVLGKKEFVFEAPLAYDLVKALEMLERLPHESV